MARLAMQTTEHSMRLNLERVPSLFSEGCDADPAAEAGGELVSRERVRKLERRAALLRESGWQRATRFAQALMRGLNPACLAAIGPTFDLLWREKTIGATGLPDPETALAVPDGLAGLAADLSPQMLATAYGRGLHPRGLMGPVTWWAPARRLVLHPGSVQHDEALRGLMLSCTHAVTFDRDFDSLLLACAEKSAAHSRMSPRMLAAFTRLSDAGIAHCFEVRDGKGRRTGGGFGIAVGRVFVLERSFSTQAGAARLGFAVLARHLAAWGFRIVDATFADDLVEHMGFAHQTRASYNASLDAAASGGRPGAWRVDPAIHAARTAVAAVRHLFDAPAPARPADAAPILATRDELPGGRGLAPPGAPAAHGARKAA